MSVRAACVAMCVLGTALFLPGAAGLFAQELDPGAIGAMDVCGDSISKGFNAQSRFPCPNTEQEHLNWATSQSVRAGFCDPGPDGVFSHAERIECVKGAAIVSNTPNSAESGAQMLKDFFNQASMVKHRLSAQPSPRYVPVLLGHNDVCSGRVFDGRAPCEEGGDQDPRNHCRTTPAAFERELRKGLDVLITIPDTSIGVAAMARVSQLCTHAGKRTCQLFSNCQSLWTTAAFASVLLDEGSGLCGSLTVNCSNDRIVDAYETARAYRDILMRVAEEYGAIPDGGASRPVTVGGEDVGGATKAPGTTVHYSDAPWRYRFNSADLSCCDCLHPSLRGQNVASATLFEGLTCTAERPCCRDTGDPLVDGRCAVADTSGTFYPGFFSVPR